VRLTDWATVRRVESDPPIAGKERLEPGMRAFRTQEGTLVIGVRVHVAGNVTSGNPGAATKGQHRVRVVLAYARMRPRELLDRRVHVRGARLVREAVMQVLRQMKQVVSEIVATLHAARSEDGKPIAIERNPVRGREILEEAVTQIG